MKDLKNNGDDNAEKWQVLLVKRNHKALNNVVIFQSTTRLAPGCWFVFEEKSSTLIVFSVKLCVLVCRASCRLHSKLYFPINSHSKST